MQGSKVKAICRWKRPHYVIEVKKWTLKSAHWSKIHGFSEKFSNWLRFAEGEKNMRVTQKKFIPKIRFASFWEPRRWGSRTDNYYTDMVNSISYMVSQLLISTFLKVSFLKFLQISLCRRATLPLEIKCQTGSWSIMPEWTIFSRAQFSEK